jgi:hypothetical protein
MSFDLNIGNYTKNELIEMFELPSNFDKNIVEIKESKLKDSIFNNKQINKETQIKTINFLAKAKNIILNSDKKSKDEKNPTETPVDPNLLYDDSFKTYYELQKSPLEEGAPANYPLQTRYEKPHTSSYPSEFYPGIINPLKKRLVRKNLIIDSRFRDNYYNTSSSNFNISLPTNFNDVIELQLTTIELPFSYYAISKQYGNNYFSITVNPVAGTTETIVISIPDGNYDQFAVTDAINTAISTAGAPFNLIAFNVDLAVGIAAKTLVGSNQMLVAPIAAGTVESIELNFQDNQNLEPDYNTPLPSKLGWMLGFRNGIYTGNVNYVSEGLVDISGPKYIFLVLDDYNNNVQKNFYSALNSSVLNNNILAQFPIVYAYPYTLYIENSITSNSAPPRSYFGPVNINNLTIQLMDEYGRIINLNNMDFSMGVTLTCIYDL